jgi:uncharacterized membrane protein
VLFGKLEKIVFLFIVLVGLMFTFLVPPFQKPDEIDHFYKSVGLLNFRDCPSRVVCVEKRFYDLPKKTQAEVQRWDETKKFDYRLLLVEDENKTIVHYGVDFSWQVSPLAYIFSAVGVFLGSFFRNPLMAFYLARLFNFIFFLFCFLWAIQSIPTNFKKIILFFAAIPMVLHQTTAISHDAVGLALVMVVVAWWLKIWEKEKIKTRDYLFFILLVAVLAFVRYGNWFLIFLTVLVPKKRVEKGVYYSLLIAFGAFILMVIVRGVSFWQQIGLLGIPVSNNFYGFQSDILVRFPLDFLRVVINSFAKDGQAYFEGLVGYFGWLDYKLSFGIFVLYFGLFVWLLDSVTKKCKVKLDFKVLLGLLIVLIINILGIFVGMYLYEGMPGGKIILFQGRYFLIFLPFLVYFLVGIWQKLKKRKLEWLLSGLVLFLVVLNIFGVIRNRYFDYSDWIEANDYLKIRAINYFDTPEDVRQSTPYLVDEKFTHNFGLEDSKGKLAGFEFVFSSEGQPVNVPYRFYIKDKDCEKIFISGFLDQDQLKKDGVYRHQFNSIKKLPADEACLVLQPYYKDSKTNFLSVVGYENEILLRFLKPRRYLMEEFGLKAGSATIGEIIKEKGIFQTFRANRNNLNGIGILIHSYGVKRNVSCYQLALYDDKCQNLLRLSDIDKNAVSHGFFADTFFDPVVDSENKTYCFSVLSCEEKPSHPITLYLAKIIDSHYRNGTYAMGDLVVDETKMNSDVIFRLFYKN